MTTAQHLAILADQARTKARKAAAGWRLALAIRHIKLYYYLRFYNLRGERNGQKL